MTTISLADGGFQLDGRPTYQGVSWRGEAMAGRLFNVRMVNATFEDRNPATCPADFDPDANTDAFIASIPAYAAHGVRAFTFNLQGGMPGYEEALNTAFDERGVLRPAYLARVRRVLDACAQHGVAAILGLFYQRQSGIFGGSAAIEQATDNAARWLRDEGLGHVLVEIANEFDHGGFKEHDIIHSPEGQVHLMERARRVHPDVLVSTSACGHGRMPRSVAEAADFLLPHANGIDPAATGEATRALLAYGSPVVFNEDDCVGEEAVAALEAVALAGGSWGYMHSKRNQYHPFEWGIGGPEDAAVYTAMTTITGSTG